MIPLSINLDRPGEGTVEDLVSRRQFLAVAAGTAGVIALGGIALQVSKIPETSAPGRTATQFSPIVTRTTSAGATTPVTGGTQFRVETVLVGQEIPWTLAFAPDGRLFFTERWSGLVKFAHLNDMRPSAKPFAKVQTVQSEEGGLLGLALSPTFEMDHFIYVYYSYTTPTGAIGNRIVRMRDVDGTGQDPTTILDAIPGARFHDGGRLQFGPDGKLYACVGDAIAPPWAQDLTSLAGKILRLNPDGSIPSDNPFPNSAIYSYGHRNPQGIAWHPATGLLYETEHGPTGEMGAFAHDEINLIEAGKNYGWPLVVGDSNDPNFVNPVLHTGDDTWAPSGCSFYNGDKFPAWKDNLFVATLRGVHMRRVEFNESGQVSFHQPLLENQYGRLRDVIQGPDGFLYFCTSNRDGRGRPIAEDDRILRIVPA